MTDEAVTQFAFAGPIVFGDESPITPSHVETAAKAAWAVARSRCPAEIIDQLPSWESAFEGLREDWRASTRAALEAYEAVRA